MEKIAFLGLGTMGKAMANSLLKKGYTLTVWNRTRATAEQFAAGRATVAGSPAQAVRDADVVICMVSDDAASRRIWLDPQDGALQAMKHGAIAIESSTLSLEWGEELARACSEHGTDFLDAPVAGSRPQAEAAQLVYVVGGPEPALNAVRGILMTMGGSVHYVGENGKGFAMKLIINGLMAAQIAVLAELSGFATTVGIDPARMTEILAGTPSLSPVGKIALNFMQNRMFDPLFAIKLVAKDMRYAVQTGSQHGAPLPVIERVAEIFGDAASTGMGDLGLYAIVRKYVK